MTAKSPSEKKKAIKNLLQYAGILAAVLLVLISATALLQKKQIEEIQSQNKQSEMQLDNNKTALQNIQDENTYLKKQVDSMKIDIEALVEKSSGDNVEISSLEDQVYDIQERLNQAQQLSDRMEILLSAQKFYNSKKYKSCKTELQKLTPVLNELPDSAKAVYNTLYSKVKKY